MLGNNLKGISKMKPSILLIGAVLVLIVVYLQVANIYDFTNIQFATIGSDGTTVFFSYNERPLASGLAQQISTPIGAFVGTGQTISCPDDKKVFNGINFDFCIFSIRFFSGSTIIGDFQFDNICYGIWSGRLSTTCAYPPKNFGGVIATNWVAYVRALRNPTEIIIDGAVQTSKIVDGNKITERINGATVRVTYGVSGETTSFEQLTYTHPISNQMGVFSFEVPVAVLSTGVRIDVKKQGFQDFTETFVPTTFQNTRTIQLIPLGGDDGNGDFNGDFKIDSNLLVIIGIFILLIGGSGLILRGK